MHKLKAVCAVLCLVLIATICLPLVAYDYSADDETYPIITVYDENQVYRHETAALTVAGFLGELGITLDSLDRISYPPEAQLYDGMEITVYRAIRFNVITDDNPPRPFLVRHGTTVAQVYDQVQSENELALLIDDDMDRVVHPQETLRFLTWRSRFFTETLEIPYETVENHTGNIRAGRTYTRQVGEPGEHELTVMVVYIGGREESRTIAETVVISEPVEAVYDIGTARLGALADTSAPDFRFARHIRMEATAYTAEFCCTGRHPDDPWYGITASGRRVEHGIVAVDRSVIPLGTHLYVEGYGFAIAADVGGAIVGNKIDLYMYEMADALRFGRRHINVWVLN